LSTKYSPLRFVTTSITRVSWRQRMTFTEEQGCHYCRSTRENLDWSLQGCFHEALGVVLILPIPLESLHGEDVSRELHFLKMNRIYPHSENYLGLSHPNRTIYKFGLSSLIWLTNEDKSTCNRRRSLCVSILLSWCQAERQANRTGWFGPISLDRCWSGDITWHSWACNKSKS
jgi:hypothetical protein